MRSVLNGGWISRPSPRRLWQRTGLAWLACALATAGMAPATAATETVIHNFGTFPNGANPYGTVIRDAAGNLYGTTYQGGAHNLGTVFELEASGKLKLLYSFQGGGDGANPYAGVTRDAAGNLYGTTYYGGAANAGVVYKLEPSGQEMGCMLSPADPTAAARTPGWSWTRPATCTGRLTWAGCTPGPRI